jgi:multicomponent Na+:H+ antiporter subunit G
MGGFIGITGGLGFFRFPDFYTRAHAASITDTLCAGLIIFGLVLQSSSLLMVLKLVLLLLTIAYTGPTATHTLVKAARREKLEPVLDNQGDES